MFTWKKGLGELEEKPRSQNKNKNKNMNQMEWSLSVNCSQKIKMVILNWNLKTAEAAFLENYI